MLTRREFFKRMGIGIGVTALFSAGGGRWLFSQEGDVIRVAIGIDPDTLEPIKQTTTLISMIVNHIVECPLFLNPETQLEPLLATEWSISPDNRLITLKFRKGVEFHDGTPMDADAISFSLERAIDPEWGCRFCSSWLQASAYEVVDKDELVFRLIYEKPFAPALMALTSAFPMTAIVSPTAYEKLGAEGFSRQPIGTGPFKVVDWIRGERLILERFEDYWGEPTLPKRIEWLIVPEHGTRSAMVLAGDADIVYQPPAPDIPRFQQDPNVDALVIPSTRIMFTWINTTHEPLGDVRVRRALNYAVDKNAIVERVIFGAGVPNDAPIPRAFFGHSPIGFYEYDPDRAKQLLDQAGVSDLKLLFIHPTGRYILDNKVAEVIQAFLADVGIQCELQTMDWPTYVSTTLAPKEEAKQDLGFLGWGPLPDAHHTLFSMFHSSQHPKKGVQRRLLHQRRGRPPPGGGRRHLGPRAAHGALPPGHDAHLGGGPLDLPLHPIADPGRKQAPPGVGDLPLGDVPPHPGAEGLSP